MNHSFESNGFAKRFAIQFDSVGQLTHALNSFFFFISISLSFVAELRILLASFI